MGQTASSLNPTPKSNLYDLLAVERNADESEIRRAYKKMALKLHPDRNRGKEQEAATQFAKVLAAYEILMDPKEREWYDERDETAEYSEYSAKVTKSEEVRRAMDPAFTRGLDPTKDEMYRLASEFFEKLRNEEMEAAFEQEIPQDKVPTADAPLFGHLGTQWPQVKAFYDTWTAFSTHKTFSWEDIYPVHHAEDRRSRRAMENRNKRVRDSAKKEFNDSVRRLVFQLYSVDERVKKQQKAQEKKHAQNARKQEEAKAAQSATAPAPAPFKEQEWAQIKETADDNTECIACDLVFDTPDELVEHELSTSHTKAVKELHKQMLQDQALLNQPKQKKKQRKNVVKQARDEDEDVDELTAATDSLSVEDIMSSMDQHRKKAVPAPKKAPKLSKAKLRKQQRAETQEGALVCCTCSTSFLSREELQDHCSRSKHVMPIFRNL